MGKIRNGLRGHGYDQEEAYFHKLDQQLIQKGRESNRSGPDLKLIHGAKRDTDLPHGIQAPKDKSLAGKKAA